MKITLHLDPLSRQQWIDKINKNLEKIKLTRNMHDRAYEAKWRKRMFLKDRSESEFPPEKWGDFRIIREYPSTWYRLTESNNLKIKSLLENDSVKEIVLSENEYDDITISDK